jgi:hypothetical protein
MHAPNPYCAFKIYPALIIDVQQRMSAPTTEGDYSLVLRMFSPK